MSRASFIQSLQGFPRTAYRPSMAGMVRQVSAAMGQDPDVVMSKARAHPIAHCRQEVMRRAKVAGVSKSEIARFFEAHPTTVRHGIAAATNRNPSIEG